MDSDLKNGPATPNLLTRSVAKIALSIRVKLLVAFLGITALLAGLALFGLSALQQANARTEKLLHDQERISAFYELIEQMGNIRTLALATIAFDPGPGRAAVPGISDTPAKLLLDQFSVVERSLAQNRRRLGESAPEDLARFDDFAAEMKAMRPYAFEIREARRKGVSLTGAEEIVEHKLLVPASRLQRDAITAVREIKEGMAQTARRNALDYELSRQQVTGAALLAVGLALLLGYAISSAMIWPVQRIGETLRRVADGAFDARVAIPNRDELGELAGNVNTMSARLGTLYEEVEERRAQLSAWNTELENKVTAQVDEIERTNRLKRFLPAQVAKMVVGATDEADVLRTQRAEITVLFADLRGFTAFATAATPDQVVDALNTFHGACGPLVEVSGGTLERFLGDGLMVLFGAPVPMEHAAQKAVDLAREMMVSVRAAMAPFQAGADGRDLGLGIGIGTGAATLGQIGFEGRLDYSAIGPAPNLAARLCDMASDGQILISHATAWQVESEMTPTGPFDLKGIGKDIAAFELVIDRIGQ